MSNNTPLEMPSSTSTPARSSLLVPREILNACRNIEAAQFHNHVEAIRQATELCSEHGNFGIVHATKGAVILSYWYSLHASNEKDSTLLQEAIASLQRAADMVPESPYNSYYLAQALSELADLGNAEHYHKVVEECERALCMDVFNHISRMNDQERNLLENLKTDMEKMWWAAKEKEYLDKEARVRKKLSKNWKANLRKLDFTWKTGEYWRKLSYDEKCRFLDLEVADVERFYSSWKNRNSQALSIVMEGVDMYREKLHWITWTCCVCQESRKKEDYDVWSSIENHINDHFDGSEPMLKGGFDYESYSNLATLEMKDGVFIVHNVLDKWGITREICNATLPNYKFLWEWLIKEHDAKLELELWEKERVAVAETGFIFFDQIVQAVSEHLEKNKPEAEEDKKAVVLDISDISEPSFEESIISQKRDAVSLSVYDYREIIVPLLKPCIQYRLERAAERQAKTFADAKKAELNEDNTPEKKRKRVTGQVEAKSREGQNSDNDDEAEEQEGELIEGSEINPIEESIQIDSESQTQHDVLVPNAEDNKQEVRPGRDTK